MIRSDQLDEGFVQEILAEPGGEHLLTCWSCGTCASTCLVRLYEPAFNPRVILQKAGLGLREQVLSSPEIWQCSACDLCYPRCPKEIHISEVMKAIRAVAIREGYERPGETAQVNVERCVACGMCVAVCPYDAVSLETVPWRRTSKRSSQVNDALCMACGICSATCPSLSITVDSHSDKLLHKSLDATLHSQGQEAGGRWRGKILAIVCNWCLHSEADRRYAANPPDGVMVIKVPCSGRVAPALVLAALQRGVEGVLVAGCKEDQCHYIHGNLLENRRMGALRSLLDLLGMEQERVRFVRLGMLDRGRLPRLIDEVAGHLGSAKAGSGVAKETKQAALV